MEILENLFDSFPREIATSILQLASELSPIATLARVCSSWQRIIYSKAFWQKCLERWQNNCCLLHPNPDFQVYLIPFREEDGRRIPDYKRYYFARKNLADLSQAINDIEHDLADDTQQEATNNLRATNLDSELTVENYEEISKWLEFAPIDSDISKMGFWFISDFFKIFLERNDERYKSIFFPARFELRASDASRISFSSTFIDLAHFVGDKHVDTTFEMVKKACLSFGKVKEANERFGKAFRDIIEQQILLGRYCTVEDDDAASFRFCMPTEVYSSDLIQADTPNAEELHQILCEVAQSQYENSNDWRIKAGALSALVQSTSHDNELVKSTAIRLGLDAIKSPHEIVRLHGYITLHSVLVMSDNSELKDSEILLLFRALSDAIDTQPKNFGLYYIEAIGCLIAEENSDLITDEMLNKLNNSIIELLLDSSSIDQSNNTVLISLCKLGSIFGKRIASFVPRYKHALLGVILKRDIVSSAELLDIYFRLGFKSCGDEFMQEVSSLIEQAEEGKDLIVDLPLLYCLIGDIIKLLLGWKFNNKNSQKILQTMIKFFDERFALYGQSNISNMRDIDSRQDLVKLPENSDHSRRYFQQVIKRLQDGENLSNDDADEILEQTKNDPNDDSNEDMISEFITAPSIFAADAVVAENGEAALRTKLITVNHKRAIVNIMKLTVEMEQNSFPYIQQVFHIALAAFRLELQTERFIRPFIDLIKAIASLLTKQQLTYYLTLLTNTWVPYSLGRLGVDHVEALHELFAVVFSLSIENTSVSANIIRNLLSLSTAIDQSILSEELEDFEHGSLLEYLSVLVTKLPNKTRLAITRTDLPLYNDENEQTIELAVRIMTILGFTYGVKFINLNTPFLPQPTATALRDRCLPLISKFSPDLSHTLMKPFVVLLSCCAIDDRIMDFIEMRRVFDYTIIQEAINSPQFSTGNDDLDREVKKLSNNPFALFAALKRK